MHLDGYVSLKGVYFINTLKLQGVYFINKIKIKNIKKMNLSNKYLEFIATCSLFASTTTTTLETVLSKHNLNRLLVIINNKHSTGNNLI